jgi:hypothetical protein
MKRGLDATRVLPSVLAMGVALVADGHLMPYKERCLERSLIRCIGAVGAQVRFTIRSTPLSGASSRA